MAKTIGKVTAKGAGGLGIDFINDLILAGNPFFGADYKIVDLVLEGGVPHAVVKWDTGKEEKLPINNIEPIPLDGCDSEF